MSRKITVYPLKYGMIEEIVHLKPSKQKSNKLQNAK